MIIDVKPQSSHFTAAATAWGLQGWVACGAGSAAKKSPGPMPGAFCTEGQCGAKAYQVMTVPTEKPLGSCHLSELSNEPLVESPKPLWPPPMWAV
jgi:hypothetical protein